MSFTITKKGALPESEYEIEGEIHADIVKGFREEALKAMGAEAKMDGFRPGHVPEKILVDRFGEVAIQEEAGRMALEKHYGDILADAKINPLGSPAVTITKVAPGEAFGFKIKTAVMPEVKLPDYEKIAADVMKEKSEIEVTEKEIDDTVTDLQKQVAHNDHHIANPDDHSHDHGDLALPEVNEEFIKKFGAFENIEAFRAKIKESITVEKERKAKDVKRLKAMDAIIAKATISMPKMLIDSELSKMLNEMGANISQMGLTIEGYLKHIGKTLEEMKKDWMPDAEKRAKTQLILNQIALDKKLTVTEEEMKNDVDQIMKMYKEADRVRASIYVETILLNEKAWKVLEGDSK